MESESDKKYVPDYNKLHPLGIVTVAVSPDGKRKPSHSYQEF